jgi:hypothetical protein
VKAFVVDVTSATARKHRRKPFSQHQERTNSTKGRSHDHFQASDKRSKDKSQVRKEQSGKLRRSAAVRNTAATLFVLAAAAGKLVRSGTRKKSVLSSIVKRKDSAILPSRRFRFVVDAPFVRAGQPFCFGPSCTGLVLRAVGGKDHHRHLARVKMNPKHPISVQSRLMRARCGSSGVAWSLVGRTVITGTVKFKGPASSDDPPAGSTYLGTY